MSKIETPSAKELQDLDGGGTVAIKPEREVAAEDPAIIGTSPTDTGEDLPNWADTAIPSTLKIPSGRTVVVMKFRAEWTDTPHKGDRTCVLWNLSCGDIKIANERGGDNGFNTMIERAKKMVRAIDGLEVDYSGRNPAANLQTWWTEIGEKCRVLIQSHYSRSHSLDTAERIDFLAHCVVARTNLPTG